MTLWEVLYFKLKYTLTNTCSIIHSVIKRYIIVHSHCILHDINIRLCQCVYLQCTSSWCFLSPLPQCSHNKDYHNSNNQHHYNSTHSSQDASYEGGRTFCQWVCRRVCPSAWGGGRRGGTVGVPSVSSLDCGNHHSQLFNYRMVGTFFVRENCQRQVHCVLIYLISPNTWSGGWVWLGSITFTVTSHNNNIPPPPPSVGPWGE